MRRANRSPLRHPVLDLEGAVFLASIDEPRESALLILARIVPHVRPVPAARAQTRRLSRLAQAFRHLRRAPVVVREADRAGTRLHAPAVVVLHVVRHPALRPVVRRAPRGVGLEHAPRPRPVDARHLPRPRIRDHVVHVVAALPRAVLLALDERGAALPVAREARRERVHHAGVDVRFREREQRIERAPRVPERIVVVPNRRAGRPVREVVSTVPGLEHRVVEVGVEHATRRLIREPAGLDPAETLLPHRLRLSLKGVEVPVGNLPPQMRGRGLGVAEGHGDLEEYPPSLPRVKLQPRHRPRGVRAGGDGRDVRLAGEERVVFGGIPVVAVASAAGRPAPVGAEREPARDESLRVAVFPLRVHDDPRAFPGGEIEPVQGTVVRRRDRHADPILVQRRAEDARTRLHERHRRGDVPFLERCARRGRNQEQPVAGMTARAVRVQLRETAHWIARMQRRR